jgi:hypothetical protein
MSERSKVGEMVEVHGAGEQLRDMRKAGEESWVRDRGLSEACLFIPKGRLIYCFL